MVALLLGPMSVATASPASATSTAGTDFWVVFPRIPVNSPARLEFFITGSISTTGTVSGGKFSTISFTVTPGQVTTVTIPSTAALISTDSGVVADKGIRVTAGHPITVHGMVDDTGTSGGFLAIPVNALGSRYRIVAPVLSPVNPPGNAYYVVGTTDNTDISADGTPLATIHAGQVYVKREALSGTLITSTQPVAVFSGNENDDYPGATSAKDLIADQLPPTDAWGSDFIVLRYANKQDVADRFIIVADQDGTEVRVDGTLEATLAAGGIHEFDAFALDGTSTINGGRITTSKPTLLTQFMRRGDYGSSTNVADPAMAIIPPTGHFQSSYTLRTMAPTAASNVVNVVMSTAAVPGFRLNGAAVSAPTFEALGTTGFSGAQIEIPAGVHTLSADQPFGVVLYGYGTPDSDAYAVSGGWDRTIPTAVEPLVPVVHARPVVTCSPDPVAPGGTVACDISEGPGDHEMLWRASSEGTLESRGVMLDVDGRGTFSFVVPRSASGRSITVELVDWNTATAVGVSSLVPANVPAGEAPSSTTPTLWLALGLSIALILLVTRRDDRSAVH